MTAWDLKPARDLNLPPLERYRSYQREGGLVENIARWCWLAGLRSTFGWWNNLQVIGRENLPLKPPFVLIANHASHLDALVLSSLLNRAWRDRIFPLAAADVFFEDAATAAFAATVINALPVVRKGSNAVGLKQMRERLIADEAIFILFPEGCRSRTGEMTAFKPGVGMLLAETGIPVVPCHLQGAFEALPAGKALPRREPITVTIGTARQFAETPHTKTGWMHIAHSLEEDVRGLGTRRTP